MNATKTPDDIFERMVVIRRDLHRHPELSFEEHRTAGVVADELRALGYEPRTGVAKTGVLATIDSGKPGPHILLRADMDALPIEEQTGLPFASTTPKVMHACGHDGHTAMLLGAAALLKREAPAAGKISLLFQPAEERFGGAQKVVEEGHLKGVDRVFGFHLDYHYDVGQVALQSGPVSAAQDGIVIEVTGRGGHAARPQECVDAIVIAAQLITQLQTLVSRVANPVQPAVFTVGRIEGGSAANAIAETVSMRGTLRTLDPNTRDALHAALHRCCDGLAAAHGAKIELTINPGYPAVVNAPAAVAAARAAVEAALGADAVVPMAEVNMASEDFAYLAREAPGCFMRLGCRKAGAEVHPTHSPKFDFDEAAMRHGAAIFHTLTRLAAKPS